MVKQQKYADQKGFTLVELAIVLVIIGLIIGGVLAGQTLIRNAEMRAVSTEKDEIEAAINTYRIRYKCIPGDCPDATKWWGARDPDPFTCIQTVPVDNKETCNGSGDKRIWNLQRMIALMGAGDMPGAFGEIAESLLVWQQLGNAGLIKSNLTGAQAAGPASSFNINMTIGVNAPKSKIDEGTWFLEYVGTISPAFASSVPQFFPGTYSQLLAFGAITWNADIGYAPYGPVFTTQEAYALDQKIDDGKPGTGVLKTFAPVAAGTPGLESYVNNCASSTDPDTAEYNVNEGKECSLLFKLKM